MINDRYLKTNWKKGDNIVCVDADGSQFLIKNKIYNVVSVENTAGGNYVNVKLHSQSVVAYFCYRFISIKDDRLKKLKKINKIK